MRTAADRKRQEERVKLAATALSNVGVATIITGMVAPSFAGRLQISEALAVLGGALLHLVAQGLLHYVADDPVAEDDRMISPSLWLIISGPLAGLLMVGGTFAIMRVDEANGRRRRDKLKKRQSTDG